MSPERLHDHLSETYGTYMNITLNLLFGLVSYLFIIGLVGIAMVTISQFPQRIRVRIHCQTMCCEKTGIMTSNLCLCLGASAIIFMFS